VEGKEAVGAFPRYIGDKVGTMTRKTSFESEGKKESPRELLPRKKKVKCAKDHQGQACGTAHSATLIFLK
jgi:hypothetical protein